MRSIMTEAMLCRDTPRHSDAQSSAMTSCRTRRSSRSCCLLALALALHRAGARRRGSAVPHQRSRYSRQRQLGDQHRHDADRRSAASASYQLPQIDLNFGLGDRIQLTYEIPYVLQTRNDAPTTRPAGATPIPGFKWRFFDQGEGAGSSPPFRNSRPPPPHCAQRRDLPRPARGCCCRWRSPKAAGPFNLDFEAGYYLQGAAGAHSRACRRMRRERAAGAGRRALRRSRARHLPMSRRSISAAATASPRIHPAVHGRAQRRRQRCGPGAVHGLLRDSDPAERLWAHADRGRRAAETDMRGSALKGAPASAAVPLPVDT